MIKLIKNETDIGIHNPISVIFRTDSTVYLTQPFENFNPKLLEVYVHSFHEFEAFLTYSFDGENWSKDFKLDVDLPIDDEVTDYINKVIGFRDINYFPTLFIAIRFIKTEKFDEVNYFNEAKSVVNNSHDYDEPNVEFLHIKYDGELINVDNDVRIKQSEQTNNRFPKWSIYENYDVVLNKWYDDIDAVTNIVGHPIIYFKTAVKTESHTLQTFDEKSVISIKRFKITFPQNQLPKDNMIYTEAEYMMMDDSYCEISWRIFRQIFGEKALPDNGDLIFIPILNKMFKIVHVEPDEDKKFMGKIGWFNAYLAKYTNDDTINFDEAINGALNHFNQFDESLFGDVNNEEVLLSFGNLLDDTVMDRNDVLSNTNEEKKKTTENYTNKLIDTTTFVSPKETDSIRKNINKRIDIVSVNPSQNTYPINMYDCKNVTRKTLGLEYDLKYLQKLSNLNLYPSKSILLSFNFVSMGRNTTQIFEIISDELMMYSVQIIKNKFNIVNQSDIDELIEFDHEIFDNEYYQINVEIKQRSISLHIYLLRDKSKKLIFKDVYIDNNDLFKPSKTIIDGLCLFGGNFLVGEPNLKIDDVDILTDYVNPILKQNSFGN